MLNPLLAFVLFYLALGAAYVACAMAWVRQRPNDPTGSDATKGPDVDVLLQQRLAEHRRNSLLEAHRAGTEQQA